MSATGKASAKKNPADELARLGNEIISENERLERLVETLRRDNAVLRATLEAFKGNADQEVKKRHVLATTGEPLFEYAAEGA